MSLTIYDPSEGYIKCGIDSAIQEIESNKKKIDYYQWVLDRAIQENEEFQEAKDKYWANIDSFINEYHTICVKYNCMLVKDIYLWWKIEKYNWIQINPNYLYYWNE